MSYKETLLFLEKKEVPQEKAFDFLATLILWLEEKPEKLFRLREKKDFLSKITEIVAEKENFHTVLPVLAGFAMAAF